MSRVETQVLRPPLSNVTRTPSLLLKFNAEPCSPLDLTPDLIFLCRPLAMSPVALQLMEPL